MECEYLVNIFRKNKDMQIIALDLSYNSIGNFGMLALSGFLADNKDIVILNLSHNNIGDLGVQYLSIVLPTMKKIHSLFLHNNKITSLGGQRISKATACPIRFWNTN